MNKKLLVLLPIAMLALAGCNQGGQGGQGGGGEGGGGGGTPTPTPAPEPTGEVVSFDFSGETDIPASGHTTWINDGDDGVPGFFARNVKSGDAAVITDGSSRGVCIGNGTGGKFENQSGFIKFGNGSTSGWIELSLSSPVFKVTVEAHDWLDTKYNLLVVNGAEQYAPSNTEGDWGTLEYTVAEPSETLKIESKNTDESRGGRLFIKAVTLEF